MNTHPMFPPATRLRSLKGLLTSALLLTAATLMATSGDTNRPTVKISYPLVGAQVANPGSDMLVVWGEATDNVRVASVDTVMNGTSSSAVLGGWHNQDQHVYWTNTVRVSPGTNILTVTSRDTSANVSTVGTVKFYFNVQSPITLVTNGEGGLVFKLGTAQVTNGQPLLVRRPYTATVLAGTNGLGWLFTNWSVTAYGVTTYYPTNKLTFLMESNLVLRANYITNLFTLAAGKYNGLFAPASGVAHASSGFFKAATDKKQVVSGTVYLDGDSVTFRGKFGLDGHAVCTASRTKLGKSPLVLDLWLDLADSAKQITGTIACPALVQPYVNGPVFTANLIADKETFNKTNNQATACKGFYTLVIPPVDGPTNAPGGYGYAAVTVVSNGLVKFAGMLGDGEKYTHSGVALSKDGIVPFWQPFYKGMTVWTTNNVSKTNKDTKGEIMGWLTFVPNTDATPGSTNLAPLGTLTWVKTAWTNLYYPAGFTNEADVLSSKFTPATASTNRAMPWTNEIYALMGWGGMTTPITNLSQVYTIKNELLTNTVAGFKGKVDYKTGLITGQFTNTTASPALKTLFYGAVLQDWDIGYGVFNGAPASGRTGCLVIDNDEPRMPQPPVLEIPDGMALIPAGEFTMGDTFNEGYTREIPTHAVHVSAFYMDKYEVTKALWDDVKTWATANGYSFNKPGAGRAADHPVQTVSWYDCVKWCNARSQKAGLSPAYYTDAGLTTVYKTGQVDPYVNWSVGYRLPTEAEWEKAARGGASGRRFPWSDEDTITHSRANYVSSASYAYDVSPTRDYHPTFNDAVYPDPYTSPVGYFAPNGYGLYDMAGNVHEWCWDWFESYSSGSQTDPRGPASGSARIFRGGSWYNIVFTSRSAYRHSYTPTDWSYYMGFRSVRAPAQP